MAETEVGEVLGEVSLPDPDAGVMLKFIHSYKKTFRFSQFKLSNREFHGFKVHVFSGSLYLSQSNCASK